MENNYTEFVGRDFAPAEFDTLGQIVVTNLRNHVMPLIRYATSDVGSGSGKRCECGRGLTMMGSLQGRISDIIVAPNGKLLHGEFFTHLFYGMTGVRQFQVEQLTLQDLAIRLVTESPETFESAATKLTELIKQHADSSFQISFSRVTQIASMKSGKYCFTMSHVPITFRG